MTYGSEVRIPTKVRRSVDFSESAPPVSYTYYECYKKDTGKDQGSYFYLYANVRNIRYWEFMWLERIMRPPRTGYYMLIFTTIVDCGI